MERNTERLDGYLAAFARGGIAEAEPLAIAGAEAALAAEGAPAGAALAAVVDLAQLYMEAEEPQRAQAWLADACAVEGPPDSMYLERRVEALQLLSEAALASSDLEWADTAARMALELAEKAANRRDPRLARATVALARARAARGMLREALVLCDAALADPDGWASEDVADARLLRAAVLSTMRPGRDPFDGLAAPVGLDGWRNLAAAAERWVSEPAIVAVVTSALLVEQERQGVEPALRARVIERELRARLHGEDRASVASTLRALVQTYEMAGDEARACDAQRRLATLLEVPDPEVGTRAYEAAVERAVRCSAEQECLARRTFGLFLAERRQRKSAASQLRAAVIAAQRTEDVRLIASARATLGVFLQHGGRREEARAELQRAAGQLPPLSTDGLTARTHLRALVDDSTAPCCDGMQRTLNEQIAEYVAERLPGGLRPTSVELTPQGCHIHFDVQLDEATSRHVDRLLRDALRTLRQQTAADGR